VTIRRSSRLADGGGGGTDDAPCQAECRCAGTAGDDPWLCAQPGGHGRRFAVV